MMGPLTLGLWRRRRVRASLTTELVAIYIIWKVASAISSDHCAIGQRVIPIQIGIDTAAGYATRQDFHFRN